MRLAVVIPALNEAKTLAATLDSLCAQKDPLVEIVVVDGGSKDGTPALAEERGVRVIAAPKRGRGCQIAVAVSDISAAVVLVVHADMIVPPHALSLIREKLLAEPTCPGGCLGHRFNSPRRIYRWIEWWDRRRARKGCSYGDQAQFFCRALLQSQGGFPDQPVMEDIEFCRRLARLGRPAYLDAPVIVSTRRFERRGWLKTVLSNWWLRLVYRLFGQRACGAIYRSYYGDCAGQRPSAISSG
jgi:rSAM/selenodomain-associated transferase 2